MKVSYSKVSCYNECPFKYKLKYIDKLESKFDGKPDNPLILGTSIHEGIENRSIDKAIETYSKKYSEITKENEWEILKLESILPVAFRDIPEGEYEYCLNLTDEFIGYIDMLRKVDDGLYDLYDFKYSANTSKYLKSPQIHLYKYYFERLTGNKIRDMYYVFIPKSSKKLPVKNIEEAKRKLVEELSSESIKFEKVEYNKEHIKHFFARKALLEKATDFEKRYTTKCSWCEFQKYCRTNGEDISELEIKEI